MSQNRRITVFVNRPGTDLMRQPGGFAHLSPYSTDCLYPHSAQTAHFFEAYS